MQPLIALMILRKGGVIMVLLKCDLLDDKYIFSPAFV